MIKFEREVKRYIETSLLIEPGDRVIVGCSGGVDSIVLLHFLNEYSKKSSFEVAAIHVNHMLRGAEAFEDRAFVESFCQQRQIPIFAEDIAIPEIIAKEQGNLQDICRRERYAYCLSVMEQEGYNKLAVAHHGDDQVESILMAMVRGSHDQGILGMPAKREFYTKELIRPFLSVTREEIEQYLDYYELSFREDGSNQKDSYMRNRMRHHVVPLLKDENKRIAKAFQHFSEKQRMEDLLLNDLANELLSKCDVKYDGNFVKMRIIPFQNQPLALQRRAILLLLKYLYKNTIVAQSYELWNAISTLVETTNGYSEISLPEGGIARRSYDILELERFASIEVVQKPITLEDNKWMLLANGYRVGLFSAKEIPEVTEVAKTYKIEPTRLPLVVRPRENGDRMQIVGMAGSKKVSRILIDAKIPQQLREQWLVLVDANQQILAIPGLRNSRFLENGACLVDGVVLIIDVEI